MRERGHRSFCRRRLLLHQICAAVQTQQVYKRPLSFRPVRADGLAKFILVGDYVQHVIPDLERQADMPGVGRRLLPCLLGGVGGNAPQGCRRAQQGPGFQAAQLPQPLRTV